MLKELHARRPEVPRPAVFLDRDGTINVERNHLHLWQDWQWESGAMSAIRQLNHQGFLVVVVTNQSGIARGFYKESDLHALHAEARRDLGIGGGEIDAFYSCPHHPAFTGPCPCRKPEAGMLEEASRDLNIDLGNSWIIGDKVSDLQAGLRLGVQAILVRTGYGRKSEPEVLLSGVRAQICDDLIAAAAHIEAHSVKADLAPKAASGRP